MNTLSQIIKQGIVFKQKEFLLSLCVYAYLLVSFSVLSLNLSETYFFLLQVFFLLFENYITIGVYYGIKQDVYKENFNLSEIFVRPVHFFFRVITYKLFAGFFALLMIAFGMSMFELVKGSSPTALKFITGFTILWLAFPVYLLLLTFFAPLIIITEDTSLFPSIRASVVFMRKNLFEIVKIVLLAAPFWAFAFFLIRVYNEKKGLFLLNGLVFYFIAALEVITIKVFMLFYQARERKE